VQGQYGRYLTAALERGMADKSSPRSGASKAKDRDARLKAALKANLARRKAQARARAVDTASDETAGNKNDKE
jgi:hypothetical protein